MIGDPLFWHGIAWIKSDGRLSALAGASGW
jgi:hypothetical protein